ncbi:GNAT family N-acetyltransferase [Streptomyces rapamycinicus]|uniref:GCN5 family acetyltransferase n=2 Tax=Streptomyces rapamycinicus TaxID=1226757 RepID=A0A0A0NF06_STRRN|nr:GNAT family N-acetyltransferase [Streptomyces rapamycinicus]AGP58047.1 GCN5 family acetyltransferase [Streptomyces rapamycinicus NRRL 5491]MBB4785722.1 ribosomal protein S18 acetylase RimI-like enzyme [Streptomyces rapamycinicus]RLV78813.1 GCN5 family acetyltransferase [Streptomyces rapamycinicus NRRL 5491]UTO65881.1 GNAT family N-acetyltransferase [Streptomyces rapamycinicus]UTP33836.1 GNAT family N-acetyltransferase [Streptomyces rapamycinicus NRRL 5491]
MGTDVQSFAVANLRRRPVLVEAGGFVAGFDPGTTSPYINYATPLPGARPTARDVMELIGAFRVRGLKPRLEFAPDAAPEVEPAVREAGFGVEATHAYLVCTPERLAVPRGTAAVPVAVPATDEDYRAIDAALSEAFASEFAASEEWAARLRRVQEDGGAVRFVRAPDGGCAGGATCSAPAVGTAELAGVGTRPAFRGRGIAAAVTAALTETMFARGARSVWLEYSGEGSRRVYERVGFEARGTRLYMSLES